MASSRSVQHAASPASAWAAPSAVSVSSLSRSPISSSAAWLQRRTSGAPRLTGQDRLRGRLPYANEPYPDPDLWAVEREP